MKNVYKFELYNNGELIALVFNAFKLSEAIEQFESKYPEQFEGGWMLCTGDKNA